MLTRRHWAVVFAAVAIGFVQELECATLSLVAARSWVVNTRRCRCTAR